MSQKKDYRLDPTALEKLASPFSIMCQRIVGDKSEPVTLPPGLPSWAPGTGWTKDMVVEKLADAMPSIGGGGGHYHLTASDEGGQKYEWRWLFTGIPEGVPTGVSAAMQANLAGQQRTMPAPAPDGWNPITAWQAQRAAALGMPPPAPTIAPTPLNGAGQTVYQDQLWAAKEANLKLQFALETREKDESLRRATEAAAEARREAVTVAANARAAGPSAETESIRLLREQNAQLQARFEAKASEDKFERMMMGMQANAATQAQQFQAALAAQAQAQAAQAAQVAQQFQVLQQQIAAAAAAPKGPDPLQLFMQMNAQTAAAQVEIARQHTEAAKAAAANQLTMRDVFDMQTRMTAALDPKPMIDGMNSSYMGLVGMTKQMVEMAQGMMSGQATSTVEALGGQALTAIQGSIQGYLQTRQAESANEAKIATARSQSEATTATAQAHVIAAQLQAQGQPQQLGAPATTASTAADAGAMGPKKKKKGANGKSEAPAKVDEYELNLFGPAVSAVHNLRTAVKLGNVDPAAAATAITQGVAFFKAKDKPVRVFELYEQKVFAKLVEALLPDAEREFRAGVVTALHALTAGNAPVAPPEEEEEEEGEGEEEEGTEDAVEVAPTPAVPAN